MQSFLTDMPVTARGELYYGHVLRAPIACGRLRGLRPPSLPEGYNLVRARDIPGKKTLSCLGFSHPVLADPQVHYRGQPFALMCGPEQEILTELAAAVRAEWEEQPAGPPPEVKEADRSAGTAQFRRGNPEGAFMEAFQIVEAEYMADRPRSHDPDLPGAFVQLSEKSTTVYASTQDPFGLREAVAAVLKLPSRRVRVVATRLGNPMECKFLQSSLVAVHASLLATVSRKPVWLQINAGDYCRYGFPGPGYRIRSQTALDRDGNLTGARLEIELDAGAYAPEPESLLLPALRCSWGGYKIPNLLIQAATIRSNRIPSGPFRAAGRAQAFFAAELNSSRLEEIGELDPYSWKSRNLLRSERSPGGRLETEAAGQASVPEAPKNVLDAVVAMSNFRRKHAAFAALKKRRRSPLDSTFPLRGTGLAVAYQERGDPGIYLTRSLNCTIRAVIDTDKRLHLYTSFVDHGPGIHELFARRAARLMEMDFDRITVEDVDTQAVPDTGASTLSRALSVGLPLVEQCCQAIKNKRFKSLLPIEVRRSCREPEAPARGSDVPRMSSLTEAAWGAAVVETEVDPVSLEVLVRGLWLALSCGSCDDLPGAERYVVGEAVRALGWASLSEQTGMPDSAGRLANEEGLQSDALTGEVPSAGGPCASLWAPGSLPGVPQVPPVSVRFVDGPNTVLRGFEQLPYLTVPAAYAAAVSQATGLYIDRVPITPEVIQECLET